MKIKAVEELLGLSRANIRFYEEKGLLKPLRRENRYRDYDDEDIERLKKIIILRKMGVSIEDIHALFEKEVPLNEVLQRQSAQLEAEIHRLTGALTLCNALCVQGIDIDSLNDAECLEIIKKEEADGHHFVDFCKDYLNFESNMFLLMWKTVFFYHFEQEKAKFGWRGVAVGVLIVCILRGLSYRFLWQRGSFWEGFSYPFLLFALGSAILFPIWLLNRKHPKVAGLIADFILLIAFLFLLTVIALLLYGVFGHLF